MISIISSLLIVICTVSAKVLIENEDNQDLTAYNIDDATKIFKDFVKMYKKTYEAETEYNKHLKIFADNLKYLNGLNTQADENTFEINQFADIEKIHSGSA